MTESLTERLRQRAESQTAENAKIISAELEKQSSGIRRQLNDDLAKIQTDIAGRSLSISEDLNTLSMISRRWMIAGGALILGLVILVGFFAWLLMQSAKPEAISDYRSFMQDDRRYLVFPEGSEIRNCRTSNGDEVFCVMLPSGE